VARTMEVKCSTSEMMMKRDGIGGNFTKEKGYA
jgi:hypothetical protein